MLWRLANGELDNIKPKVKSLCFLVFCLFPPCLNKVCWLRSKEVDAERFARRVGAQDDCVWCLTIQHTAGKANQIRPFFSFLVRVMDIFLRRLIVEHPVAQKDQTKSSLELCNSFAINSQITRLKLKRENTNNNKRSLKKQEILFFPPFSLS